MDKVRKYMALGFAFILSIYAYYLAVHNNQLMLPGYIFMFICLLLLGVFVILYLIYIKNKKSAKKSILKILVAIFIFTIFTNIIILKCFQYNFSKNNSTVLGYFLSSGNRNMESMQVDYATYLANLKPVFYDLLGDKELHVDSKIIQNEMLAPLSGMELHVSNLAISSEYGIDYYLSHYNPQIIRHIDINGNENKLLLFTGDEFENAKDIYIVEIDNYICISPKEILNIESNELNEKYENQQFKENKYETVILEFNNDSTIERINSDKDSLKMTIFLLFVFVSGFFMLFPFFKNSSNVKNLMVLLSFPVGSIIQIFVIMLIGLIGIPINLFWVIITECLFLLGWNYLFHKFPLSKANRKIEFSTIYVLLFALGIILYFSIYPHAFMSYDSYCNILIGKKIAYSGSVQENLGRLLMFSLVNPIWQTLASLFGVSFNYGMQPAFLLTGVASLFYLQYEILKDKGIKKSVALVINIIVMISLFTVPQVVINSTWILNNLDIGIMYGIAVALMYRYFQNDNKIYMILSYVLFIITGIARIEGGLFAIIYLVFIYTSSMPAKLKKILISCFTILYAVLFFCYFYMVKDIEEGFWTPQNAALSLGLLLIFNLFVLCDKFFQEKFKFIVENIDYFMIVVIIFGGIILSILNFQKSSDNMGNLIMNLVSTGYYGILIPCILFILGLYFHFVKIISKETRMLLVQVISYLLLIFVLMLISIHNSRVGYGDSSCRMVLHILPLCGILISNMLAEIHITANRKRGV